MNKKNTIKKTAAMLLGISFALGAAGCDFVITDNAKDLNQTVATVDITDALKNNSDEAYSSQADAVKEILGTSKISKRDLVSYFMSVGYQYVQNYGYTYEATFNMLMDALVSREIMIQYAVAYYLAEYASDWSVSYSEYVTKELGALKEDDKSQARTKELLEKYSEILAFKYFLSEGGNSEKMEDYDRVVYNLKKSINDSLDSLEQSYIKAEDEDHDHADPRTLPTNAGTEKSDYYDKSGTYGVYTGRNTLDSCGSYQDDKLEGSTTTTRKKAYNSFLANLQSYNLVDTKSTEDTSDVTSLEYYYVELSSMLGQALINKYFEDMEDQVTGELSKEYVEGKYQAAYEKQELAYKNDSAAFETALGSISDNSFVLYGLKDFGFVYNVLVPFSAEQEIAYAEAKGLGLSEDALFNARKKLLAGIRGADLRDTWISEHEHANYYDEATGKFFQSYINNEDKYEGLTHYLGNYAFQGTVSGEGDDFKVEAKKDLTIDDIVDDMEALIATNTENRVTAATAVYPTEYNSTSYKANGKVDYSKFIYRSGSLTTLAENENGEVVPTNFGKTVDNARVFDKTSDYYKTLAAVNEILFAYSTDPGSLNAYMGYAVSPYQTNFVPEFEYAAQKVIEEGVGSYAVCATDYGWHIVFCTFKYTKTGDVYGGYNHDEALGEENTFSKMYYESLKATAITDYTNSIQGKVLNNYKEDSVTLYKSRYKDLLNLD